MIKMNAMSFKYSSFFSVVILKDALEIFDYQI